MISNEQSLLVSVGDACRLLFGQNTATDKARIYRMIHTKKIEAKIFGARNYYIPRTEIERIAKSAE
jgi:hypothetical protein|tara:strand:+ start:669 stop:866 length:198 start_codon:yes stop_codon:yes gene_type:complete